MQPEHQKADLDNLAEEFLENDPQQGSYLNPTGNLRQGLADTDEDRDDLPDVDTFMDEEQDTVLGEMTQRPGAMDTEFMNPAPGIILNGDEEPGGMYGATADEILGSTGPDAQDLGAIEGDVASTTRTFGSADSDDILVETMQGGNAVGSSGMEDVLSTDLPVGGTYGDTKDVVDPETGELSDYDDEPETARS